MLKMDHVVLPVWDAAASLAFYCEVMGFALVAAYDGDDWGGRPWLMLLFDVGDGRELVLVSFRGAKRPKLDTLPRDARHLAFAALSRRALVAWRKKLTARAIDFWEEDHGP